MLIKLWPSLEEKFRGTELTRLPACLPGGKRQLSTFLKSAGVQRSACLTRLREHAAYFHSNQASSAPEHPIQSRDFELWWEWNPSAVGAGWGGDHYENHVSSSSGWEPQRLLTGWNQIQFEREGRGHGNVFLKHPPGLCVFLSSIKDAGLHTNCWVFTVKHLKGAFRLSSFTAESFLQM